MGKNHLEDFDNLKSESVEELKSTKCKNLEDMFYKMQFKSNEKVDILDTKYIAPASLGYTVPVGISKNSDLNLMSKSLLPNEVKAKITFDDITLKSN